MLHAARHAPAAASRRIARASAAAACSIAASAVPAAAVAIPATAARCFSATRFVPRPRIASPAAASPLLPRRSFASITLTPTTAREFDASMTAFLDSCLLLLESPRFESHNLDLTLADGVLSVASPARGTWVLNKHGPTRQIWLSSPLSGPRKFNLHWEAETAGQSAARVGDGWLGERDTSDGLKARLIQEWSDAFGVTIDPVADFPADHEHK